jgi:hypothetical protein
MDPLRDLLAVDERQVLEFFFTGLKDITSEEPVDSQALLYNASILAHFASTSTASASRLPQLSGLAEVFDRFVLDATFRNDPELMEWGAAHCLLFTGFFGDQFRRRHNLDWYGQVGSGFYVSAAAACAHAERRRMLEHMAREFSAWRRRHELLSRELRKPITVQ